MPIVSITLGSMKAHRTYPRTPLTTPNFYEHKWTVQYMEPVGGLEQAVFDIHVGNTMDLGYRPGSLAADGLTFRAIVLIKYAEWLIEPEQNNGTKLPTSSGPWDLWWPPIWGGSFCTASLQLRAGARLGRTIGGGTVLLNNLERRGTEGFTTETTVTDVMTWGRSGKGSVPIAVSVLNFDPTLGRDSESATVQPCHDRGLPNFKVIRDAFAKIFTSFRISLLDEPKCFSVFYPDFPKSRYSGVIPVITWGPNLGLTSGLQVTNVSLKVSGSSTTNGDRGGLWNPRCTLPSLVPRLNVWWDHGGQESRGGASWWGWWDVWSGIEGQFNVGSLGGRVKRLIIVSM
ncbi:hypothetical protein EDB89DRAFT_2245271 [Lactarius sanguifluus]|nr:hypothetical protein EDB89DRAFT_2245271 [Lactarius sanguifluus]